MVFLPRALHRCSPKVSQPPLQIAMALARLLYLPRLLKVAPTALLILLDANRSWRDLHHHDCLSMWLQATFVSQVLPRPDGTMLLSWCDFTTKSTRRWKHMVKAWARSHIPQVAWRRRCSTTLWIASAHRCAVSLALLRVWLVLCLASCPDGSLHGGTCHCQLRITVHF